jgi:hypothetical protein
MVGQPAAFHRCYDAQTKERILSTPVILDMLRLWQERAKTGPVVDFGWSMSSLVPAFYDELGEQLRVLVLHRHPISAAASFATLGFYKWHTNPRYAITPMHPRVQFPQYAALWNRMSSFERCLYRWLEVTAYGIELRSKIPPAQYKMIGFEELVKSEESLESIARFLGFSKTKEGRLEPAPEMNAVDIRSREVFPIGREWRNYLQFPDLLDVARQLGYNMEEDYVAQMIQKYQRPPGLLPFLRNVSGYWRVKSRVGNALRALGLRGIRDGEVKLYRQLSGQL